MADTQPTPSPEEIEGTVCAAVAEALAMPAEHVEADQYLMYDLGAESLDYLDIVFKLEHEFGIEITRGEMERTARGDMSEEDFAPEGVISDEGLQRLRELMPESLDKIEAGLRPSQVLELFKVQTFINIVSGKMERDAAEAAEAGG